MKDYLRKELSLGDKVVLVRPGYREFCLAEIIAFTPKNVRVKYKVHWTLDYYDTVLQTPTQLIKVEL